MISNSRLLTSKQLQLEGEFYQAFMEGGATVASFCSTEVEPMYKESDHIHIIGERIPRKMPVSSKFLRTYCCCWHRSPSCVLGQGGGGLSYSP